MQSGDNLPLYGICCMMEEMVHQAPWLTSSGPAPPMPLSRTIPVAPRCYCLLTHYPFFTLHFKARPACPVRCWECVQCRVRGVATLVNTWSASGPMAAQVLHTVMGLEHMQATNAFLLSTLSDTPYVGRGLTYVGNGRPQQGGAAGENVQSSSSLPASAAETRALGRSAAAAADEERRRRSLPAAGTSGAASSSAARPPAPAVSPSAPEQPKAGHPPAAQQAAGAQPGAAVQPADTGQPPGSPETGEGRRSGDAGPAERKPPSRLNSQHRRSQSWGAGSDGGSDPAHVSPGSSAERPDPRRMMRLASKRMQAAAAQAGAIITQPVTSLLTLGD